jgi:hypothetical protein
VKLVSFYTDSHAEMMHDFCLPSVKMGGFNAEIVKSNRQICPSGAFNDAGFADCMLEKLDLLAEQPIGKRVLYVDADCLLFDNAKAFFEGVELQKNQIAFQWDSGQLCCGVVLWDQTETTRRWWQFIRDYAEVTALIDQTAMNRLLNESKKLPVSVCALPFPTVGNWSHVRLQNKLWDGERFALPEPCYLWHANFTIGIENKIKMLQFVAQEYCNRNAVAYI